MNFRPLDILAFWGTDPVSRVISYGTAWQYGFRPAPSHVAVVCNVDAQPVLVESTMLNAAPCLIRRLHVRGCQAHFPEQRVRDFSGRVELLRLAPIWSLSAAESELATRILVDYFVRRGVTYDMGGALVSGLRRRNLLQRVFRDRESPLHQLFCSELVAAVLMRFGRLSVGNPTGFSPARLCRQVVTSGVYESRGDARLENDPDVEWPASIPFPTERQTERRAA